VPVFEGMNAKFTDEIETLEGQLAEREAERATCEQLLEFCKTLLVDISTAWQKAET
jgi:hypothetical protein